MAAPDLSASIQRPRAATTALPSVTSQSPTPRQQGPNPLTLQSPSSPPLGTLGTGDYGITSTAQGTFIVVNGTS